MATTAWTTSTTATTRQPGTSSRRLIAGPMVAVAASSPTRRDLSPVRAPSTTPGCGLSPWTSTPVRIGLRWRPTRATFGGRMRSPRWHPLPSVFATSGRTLQAPAKDEEQARPAQQFEEASSLLQLVDGEGPQACLAIAGAAVRVYEGPGQPLKMTTSIQTSTAKACESRYKCQSLSSCSIV
jgi:hypothetical protein